MVEEKKIEQTDDKNERIGKENLPESDMSEIIPDEVLEGIPIEDRGRIKSIISQTMISGVMKRSNPIADKITSDHISKLLENSDSQDQRDRTERKSEKNYQIVFLIIGLLFMAFLIVFLKEDKDLLYKIIIAIISFIGGFGIGKTKKNQKKIDE